MINHLFHKFQVGDLIRLKLDMSSPSLLVVRLGSSPDETLVIDPRSDTVGTVFNQGYVLVKGADDDSFEKALRVKVSSDLF